MKKYILLLAFAAIATSCQKMYPNGNLDVVKMTDDIVHYTDANAPKSTYVPKPDSMKVAKPKLIEPDLMIKQQANKMNVPAVAKK